MNPRACFFCLTLGIAGCTDRTNADAEGWPIESSDVPKDLTPQSYVRTHEQMLHRLAATCECTDRLDTELLAVFAERIEEGVFPALERGTLRFDRECAALRLEMLSQQCGPDWESPKCSSFHGDQQEGEPCSFPSEAYSNCDHGLICVAEGPESSLVCRQLAWPGESCSGFCAGRFECVDGLCVDETIGFGERCDGPFTLCGPGLVCRVVENVPICVDEPGVCEVPVNSF